ncbi:MAG: RecX family transcriptional regulator [Dehalococcoidia bacterium]
MITALRSNDRKKQVNVFVDGLFSFAIVEELAVTNRLKVGQHLSADQIEELKEANLFQSCFAAALHYLSYRPRSENEVRQRLRRRGFDNKVVDEVIFRLKGRRLIDDVAFSEYWRNNRLSFSPRSGRLIKLELRQKGVAAETANEVVKDLDDENYVYEAGLRKARRLSSSDYDDFRRRLYGYLRRRGFNYETVNFAVARLWQERQRGSL